MNSLRRLAERRRLLTSPSDLVMTGGAVTAVTPGALTVSGLSRHVQLGDLLGLGPDAEDLAEVIRIDETTLTAKLIGNAASVAIGSPAWKVRRRTLRPCAAWQGRILNAIGDPIDAKGALEQGPRSYPLDNEPPASLDRQRARTHVRTGVRAIDIFTPLCAGQRLGVFAGSGVGKSTLLAMLAQAEGFDAVVIALVGERGREVREFVEDTLADNAKRAVVVVATSDESAMMRRLAPKTAMAVAESFRDEGKSTLLIVDSVTRYAHALREVALAAGEPPVARGYPPSVFSDLPRLLERAGPGAEGSGAITGVFSVLVDGDDHNDPVSDCVRGVLDGHVVLDRAIANRGQFPAVDILASISRLAPHAWTADQSAVVSRMKGLLALFEETRDIRSISGHQPGRDAELDQAVALVPLIYKALAQSPASPASHDAFTELAEALRPAQAKSNES